MLNEPVTHFVEASFFMSSKKIRLCAWDWFGAENDRYIYYQVESRVTRRNTTMLCVGLCCVFILTRAFFFNISFFSLISMSLLLLSKYFG